MITVTFYNGDKRGWEFRALRNGIVESRNERKKLDWQERTPEQMEVLGDELWQIGESLRHIAAFHVEGQELPKTDGILVPKEQEYNVPV